MTKEAIEIFFAIHSKDFPPESLPYIRQGLLNLPEEKQMLINSLDFQSPTTMFLISFLLGSLGVDRFMLGDTGMGVLKLLTGGLCGILTIVDWCTVMKKTKEHNYKLISAYL